MTEPRIVGRWQDGTFYVDDISRILRGEEARLIDLRDCEALYLWAIEARKTLEHAKHVIGSEHVEHKYEGKDWRGRDKFTGYPMKHFRLYDDLCSALSKYPGKEG